MKKLELQKLFQEFPNMDVLYTHENFEGVFFHKSLYIKDLVEHKREDYEYIELGEINNDKPDSKNKKK